MDYREKARNFVENEKQFHLGFLPTEQSHQKTANFSSVILKDTAAGVDMLLSVDEDIPKCAGKIFRSDPFTELVSSMVHSILGGGRIIFSGCGATGRLAILLDAGWRHFWQQFAFRQKDMAKRFDIADMENRSVSIMTGGDRAIIRSVENFEDYPQFGRQQIRENNVSNLDTVLAITEGGETSSVLGTAREALDAGAHVFLMFNNPADVLIRNIVRSRELIENPKVRVLELYSGPMAIAGSTRMQATTFQQLVAGCAIEMTLKAIIHTRISENEMSGFDCHLKEPFGYAIEFGKLVSQLRSKVNINALAKYVEFEQDLYQRNGLITYLANDYLLDILTDTTERAPTFMLPPFKKKDDKISPPSWAFVKNPLLPTKDAWFALFRRYPKGLQWSRELYEKMNAPQTICDHPPGLDNEEIYKYDIGNEENESRWAFSENAAVMVLVGEEVADCTADKSAFKLAAEKYLHEKYKRKAMLTIGASRPTPDPEYVEFHIGCDVPRSLIDLWDHLAVKLVLNTVSTATMARMGRVYGNWMVYAETTNKKLIDRSVRLIQHFTNVSYQQACEELFKTFEELTINKDLKSNPVPPTVMTLERINKNK